MDTIQEQSATENSQNPDADDSINGFEMIDDFSKLDRRSNMFRASHVTEQKGKMIKKFVFHQPIYDDVIKIGEI